MALGIFCYFKPLVANYYAVIEKRKLKLKPPHCQSKSAPSLFHDKEMLLGFDNSSRNSRITKKKKISRGSKYVFRGRMYTLL